ncbi:MAG: AMP-binding protein [Deltaproteobacteria bacterium]|nr:AMP-binding protein [Deltaproteobacteria bacterium]
MSRRALLDALRARSIASPAAIAAADAETRLDRATLARASDAIAASIEDAIEATGSRASARAADGTAGQVALLSDHRAIALVGVLGVLESGRCLVPLNGHESDALLAAFARDARISVLLADRAHAARARAIAPEGVPVLVLEDTLEQTSADASAHPGTGDRELGAPRERARRSTDEVVAGRDDLAHDLLAILYTSGTTAAPKGVMTTAASVLGRTREYLEASGLAAGERQAAITAWHFAASIPEIYGALVAGAELRLYDAHARGVEGLSEWLRSERIDCLQLPVAIARRLLASAGRGGLAGVRFASISGDRLLRAEAEALLAAMAPGAVLLHTYGSTETNLIAQSALRLPSRDWPASGDAGVLPVGRPVAGKRVEIVDESGRPVAAGEIGRIQVASALLSPGYWNQPERTAESFRVADDGAGIFVSGDFGRLRSDGQLELVGRDAAQVKVRGMRVDLAAVEAALLAQAGVANAAVVARPDGEGEVRLVAYVEAARDGGREAELDTTRLRRALEGRMPAHAIPARFVFLDSMPWTASGKLDRRALPDPGRARPKQAVPYVAPRDAEEARVCARWAALFDLEAVGVDDGFFDLGGDSLRLVELLFALEQETGRPIPLTALGGLPTPARLAALLKDGEERPPEEGCARFSDDHRTSGEERARREASPPFGDGARRRGPLRRLRSAIKHRIRNPLRTGGPVLLGRPLPHARGVRGHALLARALVRLRLYRKALRPVERWHARLAHASPSDSASASGHDELRVEALGPKDAHEHTLERALVRSVLANTWVDWRLRALEPADELERDVVLEGAAHLEAVVDHGRGIVFIVTHVHWNALLGRLPALRKREAIVVRQPKGLPFGAGGDAIVTERALQLQAAARCLRGGGIVLIAGDEGHGRAAVERPFHGTIRRFRPGAATLAEATGAALVPVFSRLADDGRIVFRFEAPLVSTAGTAEARILDRTGRYADLFVAAWPSIYDSVTWKSVRRALEPPEHW